MDKYMITISLREYVELRNKQEILLILEAYGIAEWLGYDYAYLQIVKYKERDFLDDLRVFKRRL